MAKKKKTDQKFGWHFLPSSMKLEYGDNRKAQVGKTLSISKDEVPDCCSVGMHASEKPSQAAIHEKGPVLCRVLVSGDLDVSNDKFCGRHRTVIWAKELKDKDFDEIFKAVYGNSNYYYTKDESGLRTAASADSYKFNNAIEAWAKKNGWKSDALPAGAGIVELEFVKKTLDEKSIRQFLVERLVRTVDEIRKDMEQVWELDGERGDETLEDWLYNMSGSDDVIRVEDFGPNYEDGYVLKPKARRKRR